MVLLSIFFMPLPYIIKVAVFFHPILSLLSATLLSFFVDIFNKKLLKLICLFLIVIIVFISLPYPTISYFNETLSWGKTNGIVTSFTLYELKMSEWIHDNTPNNSFILSEPETQNIVGALSDRLTLKGPYPNSTEKEMIHIALNTTNPKESVKISCDLLRSNNIYIVISGRVALWLDRVEYSPTWSVWMPQNMSYFEGYNKFFDDTYFEYVHNESDQVYLFKIKNCSNSSPTNNLSTIAKG